MARVFHPLAISMSTNEDAMMFQFIGNIFLIIVIHIFSNFIFLYHPGDSLVKYIPNFLPSKLMSDAAPAIFNGLSMAYPNIINGRCYFHMMQCMKNRHYTDENSKKLFLNDLRSLSKSHCQEHFDVSVNLFLDKYRDHQDEHIKLARDYLEKFWLLDRNRGWHSGLVPGTVTSNNGLEVTNRVFKKYFKG